MPSQPCLTDMRSGLSTGSRCPCMCGRPSPGRSAVRRTSQPVDPALEVVAFSGVASATAARILPRLDRKRRVDRMPPRPWRGLVAFRSRSQGTRETIELKHADLQPVGFWRSHRRPGLVPGQARYGPDDRAFRAAVVRGVMCPPSLQGRILYLGRRGHPQDQQLQGVRPSPCCAACECPGPAADGAMAQMGGHRAGCGRAYRSAHPPEIDGSNWLAGFAVQHAVDAGSDEAGLCAADVGPEEQGAE